MTDFGAAFDKFLGGQDAPALGPAPARAVSDGDAFSRSFEAALDSAAPADRDAKLNLLEANKVNPETAAAAERASAETGLPVGTVTRNLDTVEQGIKAKRQAQAMQDNPFLAQFYSDTKNAAVAHDDFQKLDVLSKVWSAGVRGVEDAVAGNAIARAARPFIGGELDAATSALVKKTQKEIAAPFGGDDDGFYSFVKGAAGFIGGLVDQAVKAAPAALVGASTGAVAGAVGGPLAPVTSPVGAAVGASVGFVAGMVADGFEVGAGQLYLAMKDQKDGSGKPLDPETVKWASLGGGAILGLLNIAGAKGLEAPATAAAKSMALMFVNDAATQPTMRAAMAEFGKGLGKGVALGGAFGAANEGTMVAAETIAKVVDGGDWETILNDPAERKKAFDRITQAMMEMGAAFGAMHAVGGGAKFAVDTKRALQAEKDAAWVDNVNKAIGETATVKRDRDAIKRFLETQADGTPIEHVFVPAEKIVELYQSKGLDPFRLDNDPILGFLPDLGDQLTEAQATRGDVVIPAKDYFARLAGTEVFDKLKGDIRIRQDGMSFNEARNAAHERMANLTREADEWRARVDAGDEAVQSGARVYDDVFSKLRAAGYTNDAAGQQAAVYASRYHTRAERTGDDAWAAYERSGVRIDQVLPESLRYAEPGQLDVLLNSLRSGKDPVAPKNAAPTLMEWLARRGGALDDGGELRARDLHRWHLDAKGKTIKGRAPLIADAGAEGQTGMFGVSAGGKRKGLDDVTLSAWEDGFFPEHSERPSIDDFLAALDEEARGRPRRSEDAPHDPREAFRGARAELDETLQRLGLDINKLRNKDIRDALAKIDDGKGGLEQENRGSIKFSDGAAIISLFKSRDLSTFMHETGHLWLEELKADALHPAAQMSVKADFAEVLKFVGSKDGAFTVEQHELFARAFETYLMEGKAPSEGLRGAFQSFKQWLIAIYRNVASLQAPISDNIRGVFDRLIATDAEIAAAKAKQGLNPIFADAKAAGMTNAEYAAYTSAIAKADGEAADGALKKVMADVRQRRTKEWKEEETAAREAVTRDTMREPGQGALHLLRTGKLWDGETPAALAGVKLSKADIVTMYGDEQALKLLPFGVYKAEGGVTADALAEPLGFSSGRALVERLMGLEASRRALREKGDKRSVARSIIEEETERRMVERHGDALADGSIQAEAMAAIHSERRVVILSTELKALAKQAGEVAGATLSDIRSWAAETINGKRVKDATAFERFARAEREAGANVQRSLLKGSKLEAFKAKQEQLVNHALYVEAKKAADDRDSAVKMMDRFASSRTLKSMDQGYLEQIHGLLERFDFKRATEKELERRADFAEWAIQQQAEGVDVVAPLKLMNASFRTHFSDMTVEELRGLSDTVKQVAHLGRLKKTLLLHAERVEFEGKVEEAVSAVAGIRQRDLPDARNPTVGGVGMGESARALVERVKGRVRSLDSSLLKMEQVFDWLDDKGGKATGVFNSVVFRPLADAQHMEARLQGEVTKKLLALNAALPKATAREWMTRADYPELIDSRTGRPSSMLKADIVSIALNMGNESNRDKLLRGEKWDADAVKAVLDRTMTKADWDYVQGVWDTINGLWPYIEAMEKAVNGVAPPKVEPIIVNTPHGAYRGGYYPVIYDPARAGDVAQRSAKSADSLFENIYTRATTSKGFTNQRVESYARPLLLSLDVIPRHVSEVIHDLSFREAVRQADKFLGDKRIREAVEGVLGREVYDQFRPWLQNIANEWAMDRRGLGFWEGLAKGARTSASIVGMGLRITTMMAQVSGLSDSAEMIGAKWVGKGLGSFVGDPLNMAKTRDFVFEKSAEMRNRMDTTERDVRDAMRSLVGKTGILAETRRFAYYGIAIMDMAVSLPTWMGAYQKALHEGRSDADAVYSADKAIRLAQGAGAAKDLAAVQRGGEFQKLTTMFYSYFSHFYNRQRDIGRSARDAKTAGDFAMIAARSFFLMVAPAIIGNLIAGQGPKEGDDFGMWALRKVGLGMFLGVPVLRDVVNVADRKLSGEWASYSPTPAARAVDVIGRAADDLFKATGLAEGDVSDDWVKHALETTGYVFGLPMGQVGNTTQFLWDVNSGRQSPEDIADWFKGLVWGKFEDKK